MTATAFQPGPEMTIAQAAALRESLLAAMAEAGEGFAIDLGEVAEFDTAGVQLLLACRRTLAERDQPLRVTAASATVRRNLEVFGLQGLLETA